MNLHKITCRIFTKVLPIETEQMKVSIVKCAAAEIERESLLQFLDGISFDFI